MAAKFGKREKIIAGLVVGMAAIIAIHILVFQDPARRDEQLKNDLQALRVQLDGMVHVPDQEGLKLYRTNTLADENLLWETVFKMDLLMGKPFRLEAAPI